MSKRSIKNSVILVLFVAYILLYKLFIFNNFMKNSELISASFMIVLLAISIKLLGFRKDKPTALSRNISRIIIFYLVLVFCIMYGLGLLVGFLNNAYSLSLFNIFDNIFAPIVIIASVELIRYVVIWANKDKKLVIYLFTLVIILFEIITSIRVFNLGDFSTMFRLTATIILPVIVKNTMLSYLCYHIGYKVPLMYRLVMDVYLFVVPIVPDLGEYVNSMILMSLPFLIYISSFSMIDDRTVQPDPIFNNENFSWFDVPITVLLITMICLVSGLFPHFMIGIGSDSMRPKINKGDAVIIKKLDKKEVIKKGEVIAYLKDKRIVVHRVVKVNKDNTYTTKGDANGGNDPKEVKRKQVKGIVKIRIPVIAYPTVWLSELMNR